VTFLRRLVALPRRPVAFLGRLVALLGRSDLRRPDAVVRMRFLVAIGAYSVSSIFGLAYLLTRVVAPHTTPLLAVSVAVGAAAPLALTLLWGQLTALKVGPVQIDLAQITVPLVHAELADAALEILRDATPDIVEKVQKLVATPDTQLVNVNLHAEPYWWPSRLFFLAVLLDDYTDVRRMVFVTGGTRQDYVGMARPHVVRRQIAAARPQDRDEDVYRKAEALADETIKSGPNADPAQVRLLTIAQQWQFAYSDVHTPPNAPTKIWETPPDQWQLVTAPELRRLLGDGLSATSVEWEGGPGTTLAYYRILDRGEEFVALTRHAQLERVVSANRMATEIARQVLRGQLERGS
jgi:hypothetical protein